MPLPRRCETDEQTTARLSATAAIQARADYLPRDRWDESADASGTYRMVRLVWSRADGFCVQNPNGSFTAWDGDMRGMRFVTIG